MPITRRRRANPPDEPENNNHVEEQTENGAQALTTEQALTGQPINGDTAQKAAEAALTNAKPLSQNSYKIQLARVALKRAILKAASGGNA